MDGRCWLCTQDGPAPSPYSFLSGTLLPLKWKQGDGTCIWGNDLPRLSSSNPNNYTDLARLVFFLFCSGSKNFTQRFQSWLQLGSQAGNGSRYVWFENWGRLSSCYHLQRPTGELRVMETTERGGRGQAGQSYSCRLTRSNTRSHIHTRMRTLLPDSMHPGAHYPGVLSHTFQSSREPNKNTNLTSCSLQVDSFKFTSETVMWTAHSECILNSPSLSASWK